VPGIFTGASGGTSGENDVLESIPSAGEGQGAIVTYPTNDETSVEKSGNGKETTADAPWGVRTGQAIPPRFISASLSNNVQLILHRKSPRCDFFLYGQPVGLSAIPTLPHFIFDSRFARELLLG